MVRARSSTGNRGTGSRPRGVPALGLVSSALAPVLLIGGWTLAAWVQPTAFDSVRDTISQLAAVGMPHRWVMTAGLAGLGVCHMVTAAALRPAALPGRVVLALGGVGTLLVATNPLPSGDTGSRAHTAAASVGFVALSLWPLLAAPRGSTDGSQPGAAASMVLTKRVRVAAATVLGAVLGWFFWTLRTSGTDVGLAERAVAGAQSLWPLVVVLSLRRVGRGTSPG